MRRTLPETSRWWSAEDRAIVLRVLAWRPVHRVLEFGPGSSTLALLDGGAEQIDACEDHPAWTAVARERLAANYPDRVRIVPYVWADPLTIPLIDGERYDLALIDGPRITMNRIAVAEYCFARCTRVLSPAEKDNATFQSALEAAARQAGRTIEFIDAGPPSYGFLLLT